MREIKFRGKRLRDGKWVYGYLVFDENGRAFIVEKFKLGRMDCYWEGVAHEVDPESVGQFTGLRDEDGREIYENDIVEIEDAKAVVRRARFTFELEFYDIFGGKTPLSGGVKKVVGNVYENPELLGGSDEEA